jgi:hypothetical protein
VKAKHDRSAYGFSIPSRWLDSIYNFQLGPRTPSIGANGRNGSTNQFSTNAPQEKIFFRPRNAENWWQPVRLKHLMRNQYSFRPIWIGCVLAMCAAGCVNPGRKSLESDYRAYDTYYAKANDEQLRLNLSRLAIGDPV